MATANREIPPLIVDVIALWTGWGMSPVPKRSDQRVIDRFGMQVAEDLLPVIKSLQKDFYASATENFATDVDEMGNIASERFRRAHPEAWENVVKILNWCDAYDFRQAYS